MRSLSVITSTVDVYGGPDHHHQSNVSVQTLPLSRPFSHPSQAHCFTAFDHEETGIYMPSLRPRVSHHTSFFPSTAPSGAMGEVLACLLYLDTYIDALLLARSLVSSSLGQFSTHEAGKLSSNVASEAIHPCFSFHTSAMSSHRCVLATGRHKDTSFINKCNVHVAVVSKRPCKPSSAIRNPTRQRLVRFRLHDCLPTCLARVSTYWASTASTGLGRQLTRDAVRRSEPLAQHKASTRHRPGPEADSSWRLLRAHWLRLGTDALDEAISCRDALSLFRKDYRKPT